MSSGLLHANPRCRRFGASGARGSAVLLACIGVALALGVVAPSAAGPVLSFAASRAYLTGEDPQEVAIGDFDGDRNPDLATANFENGTVSLLLNRGDGTFEARRDYAAGQGTALSVAIGDLDGDGKGDLAVAGVNVTVRLNRGAGRFPRRDYPSGDNPFSIAIGDLNGDDKPDLATANLNANSVSVLTNRGNGTFRPHVDYASGRAPHSVAIGDLNGDGKGDLAIANFGAATISVLLNNGDGTFKAKRDYDTLRSPRSVAIGDLNGDGGPDLAVANNGSNTVSVFLSKGNGSFSARREYRTGRAPISVVIGDLNGDHKPDLATIEYIQNAVSVLLNRGDGSFQRSRDYKAGNTPGSLAIGDLNGDGKLDLATTSTAYAVFVRLNATGRCGVPNVRGTTVADARRAIARAGCRAGKIDRAYSRTVKRGRVVSQKPMPGAVLPKGGKVNLVVSRGRKN